MITITSEVVVTETRSEEFNWLTMLEALASGRLKANRFSDLAIQLAHLAANWPTCACGQLCKRLPKIDQGMPEDETLRQEGGDFSQYVNLAQWPAALACFKQIEARSTQLLAYM